MHEPKNFQWWIEQQDSIDMEPTYQRQGSLWSLKKRQLLIDSILNGYDIPKIYLADFRYKTTKLNKQGKMYAVIDGKQRLDTIFQFFGGKFRLASDFKLFSNPRIHLAGLRIEEIREKSTEAWESFRNYVPMIMSVVTDDEQRINDMFVRLNSGLSVNSAERRNAMPGIVPVLIRNLVAHTFFKEKIAFDTRRMQQYNLAAKLLLIEHHNTLLDTKAKNLDQYAGESLDTSQRSFQNAYNKVVKILDRMSGSFMDHDSCLARSGEIPVYYWLMRKHSNIPRQIQIFLRTFSEQLRENLQLSKTDPDAANRELSDYYTKSRTSNDKASMEGRFKVLEKRFAAIKAGKP